MSYIYIGCICLVIGVAYLFCEFYGFRKKFYHILMRYRRNPKHGIKDEELLVVSLGLLCAEEIHCFKNSLSTGLKAKKLDSILQNHWQVFDREAALSKLDWMQTIGDRELYTEILPYLMVDDGALKYVEDMGESDSSVGIRQIEINSVSINLLSDRIKEMRNHIIFSFTADKLNRGIISWDAARIVVLARLSYDKGFLTEPQAWSFIHTAYEMTRPHYKDWREVAIGYIIGHSMSNWENLESLDKIVSMSEDVLTNRESPWTKLKFKKVS